MLLLGAQNVNIRGILYGILSIHCHVGADWFLPTIFFAEASLFLLAKVCREKYYPLIGVASFLVAFLLTDINYLVACCRRILIALAFVLIGLSFKKLFTQKNLSACIVTGVLTVAIAYMNGIVDLSARQFGNHMLYLSGSLIGTYFILSVSQYISGTLAIVFCRVGRSSLTIMGTHQNIQVAFNAFWGSVFPLPLQIVVYWVTIGCEILIVNLYERFIPFLVGISTHTSAYRKNDRDNE